MKPLGRKHTKKLPGHQRCATCNAPTKAGRALEKRRHGVMTPEDEDEIRDRLDEFDTLTDLIVRNLAMLDRLWRKHGGGFTAAEVRQVRDGIGEKLDELASKLEMDEPAAERKP